MRFGSISDRPYSRLLLLATVIAILLSSALDSLDYEVPEVAVHSTSAIRGGVAYGGKRKSSPPVSHLDDWGLRSHAIVRGRASQPFTGRFIPEGYATFLSAPKTASMLLVADSPVLPEAS